VKDRSSFKARCTHLNCNPPTEAVDPSVGKGGCTLQRRNHVIWLHPCVTTGTTLINQTASTF